jgi:hypothetical protein
MKSLRLFSSRLYAAIFLALAAAGFIACSYFLSPWSSGLLQNIGSGLLTSLVLIGFYDRIVERRVEDERKYREDIAIRHLAYFLKSHVRVFLFQMFRSSSTCENVNVIDYLDFVKHHFARESQYLNVLARSSSGVPVSPIYVDWIAQNARAFKEELDRWITTYAATVDPTLVKAVTAMLEADYLKMACHLDSLIAIMRQVANVPDSVKCFPHNLLVVYAKQVSTVIELIEAALKESLGKFHPEDWQNALFPIGHARVRETSVPERVVTPTEGGESAARGG